MRRRRKRFCLILLALALFLILSFKRMLRHSLYETISNIVCDKDRGHQVLSDMCRSYYRREVAGNMCEDICKTGRLVLDQCLSHKNDNVIFSADWRGKQVILKAKKMSSYESWENTFPDTVRQDLTVLQTTFLTSVHDHVILQLIKHENRGNHSLYRLSPKKLLAQLYFNTSINNMTRNDMQSLWLLLQQDEFFVMQLLKNFKHIPRIHGACGQFYVLEKVQTLDEYLGFHLLSQLLTWKTRVKLALEIMDLVHELRSQTVYGSWQHCDIQPSNFGIDGNGVVKAIDVDLMYTSEKILEVLNQQDSNCTTNEDCEFFDCASTCDTRMKKCTAVRISNNLQVVCRDLFISKWIERGLLSNIPSQSRSKFNKILKECSAVPNIPWTKRKYYRIFNTLSGLLKDEMRRFT